ncbi:metalloregulator ArsR/SmtB family transcription factor [Bombilactobacillus folatiphilus]|uniref:Metalloregulator ArsR/SmtB family transcription factor n=1 Tax=Bombilactobacillus folatiphilus TaxID=2923362 RepID=A0ABY4P7U9_9LACO|nr:metalloregulator ArsR/SmtB family transcription factor [Bombilactobacillus folatiphilus]UQS81785.1 metalloregulator ArsR/SmtB family transcription factor [Bombilactobacillus folatiphilus]
MIIEQLTKNQIRVQIFKALSDEARLTILHVLNSQDKEWSCGEIGESLNISKSTVSYHFKILREAGLTNTRKVGQNRFVSLNRDFIENILPGFLDII